MPEQLSVKRSSSMDRDAPPWDRPLGGMVSDREGMVSDRERMVAPSSSSTSSSYHQQHRDSHHQQHRDSHHQQHRDYPHSCGGGRRHHRAPTSSAHHRHGQGGGGHPPSSSHYHSHEPYDPQFYNGRTPYHHGGPAPVLIRNIDLQRLRHKGEFRDGDGDGDGFQIDTVGRIPPPSSASSASHHQRDIKVFPGNQFIGDERIKVNGYYEQRHSVQSFLPPLLPSSSHPRPPHPSQYYPSQLQDSIPAEPDDRLFLLTRGDVLTRLVRLGDTTEKLVKNIDDLADYLKCQICHRSLDSTDFKDVGDDFRLLAKPGGSEARRTVESNIGIIASAVAECAAFLPTKSSLLASVVGELGVHLTRPPEGVSMADVTATVLAPEVKLDPTDESSFNRHAQIEKFRLQRLLLNCWIRSVLQNCTDRLDEYFKHARIVESKNLICFLMELTDCHVILPSSLLGHISHLLHMAKDVLLRDPKNLPYLGPLIDIVLCCLARISCLTAEAVVDQLEECFVSLEFLVAQWSVPALASQALSGVWVGRDGQQQEQSQHHGYTLTKAYRGLTYLRDSRTWSSKALWKVYQTGTLAVTLASHDGIVQHSLPALTFSFQDFSDALEKNRLVSTQIALGAGAEVEFHLIAESSLGSDSESSYASAAAEMGVGGSSLGLNGCWGPRCSIVIWSDSQIVGLLSGVRPLEVHDRWLLEELFLSVLHCFRHTPELCSETLLRIPMTHDQFEATLVEVIFNEMLRLPHSAEPTIFYIRLLDFIVQKQRTVAPLIESALVSLSYHSNRWDNQTNEILAEFLGLWLSLLPDGPQSFQPLYGVWSPEALRQDPRRHWKDLGNEFLEPPGSVVSVLDRSSLIAQQRLPYSLKLFFERAMNRLTRVVTSPDVLAKLPAYLQPYLPQHSQFRCSFGRAYEKLIKAARDEAMGLVVGPVSQAGSTEDDTASIANTSSSMMADPESARDGDDQDRDEDNEHCPLEYILFRKLIQIRFADQRHQRMSVLQMAQLILYRLLGRPALSQLPSDAYITRCVLPVKVEEEPKEKEQSPFEEAGDLKFDNEKVEEVQMTGYTATVKDEEDDGPSEVYSISDSRSSPSGGQQQMNETVIDGDGVTPAKDQPLGVAYKIDIDHDVEKVEDGDGGQCSAIDVKDEDTEKPSPTRPVEEQNSEYQDALARVMSEDFVCVPQQQEDALSQGGWSLCALAELLMRALLGQGAKTLTHSGRVLDNYQELLVWLRPSSARTELIVPKNMKDFVSGPNADGEYFAALLRSIFSFWRDGPVKCQFVVDKLTRLGVIPVAEVQAFILHRLSLNRLGDLSTQEILFHLVREGVRRYLIQEQQLKLLQRQQRFETLDDKKLSDLLEGTTGTRLEIKGLVVSNLVDTTRRLMEFDASRVSLACSSPVATVDDDDDDDDGVVPIETGARDDGVQILGNLSKQQRFIERQAIRRLLHYGRTFIQFIDLNAVRYQVTSMNLKADIAEVFNALAVVQEFLFPHGISEDFSGTKKDQPKDEEELPEGA